MTATGLADGPLARLAAEQPIIVCCGSGGVGKTTTAAVLALAGARLGRNAIVVTIDPAKRLANALGLDALSDTAHEIERELWDPDGVAPAGGRLSALMLDTKSTFDHLVLKYSADEVQGERILKNTFYRNLSGALAGTQEYMAMEKLHELHDEGGYDLIVIDTPPTRNALDFLDAPARITRLLNNKLFRLVMAPTRASFRVANFALQAFFRTVAKVIGKEVVDDLVLFFQAFEGMEEGFRVRATRVMQLLSDRRTAFVLVTAPARDAVSEARYFHDRLEEAGLRVSGLVVNRIHPQFGDAVAPPPGSSDGKLGELYANLADFIELSKREQGHLDGLERSVTGSSGGHPRTPAVPIVRVPLLEVEVCDIASLTEVGRYLLGPASAAASGGPEGDG
jgi:anion-transporting  ArsA/GET3 family ATPase